MKFVSDTKGKDEASRLPWNSDTLLLSQAIQLGSCVRDAGRNRAW